MYAAACFFDLPSRSLITAWYKGVLKGRLRGVLPLHHNECCSKLQGPVNNENKGLMRLIAALNPLKKATYDKSSTPKLYQSSLR